MKKSIYLILFFITPLCFSQKTITKKHYGSNTIKEQFQINSQGQRNGFYKSFNENGILLFSYNFKNDKEHGLCIDYAGSRNYKEIYCYGKPLSERMMENGEIKSEKYYGCANNTNFIIFSKKLIKPGVYERIEFHKNGKISEKFNENSSYGKENGTYEKFYENGKLAEKGIINSGKYGTWVGFYENGDSLYFAKYGAGIETYYKKFIEGNKIEYVKSLDYNFETITKIFYYPEGNLKLEQRFKTYPFIYQCGGNNPPTNWRELAERRIVCGGDSYSPYDNSFLAYEKNFKTNGDIESETVYDFRIVKGRKIIAKKLDFEQEDSLWHSAEKERNFESVNKYFNETTLKIYYEEVRKIYDEIYTEWNKKFDDEMNKLRDKYQHVYFVFYNKIRESSESDKLVVKQEIEKLLQNLYKLDLKKINRELMIKGLSNSTNQEMYDYLKTK
jgi:antitoxin component YwqK of YwqJK toxin-antitoxin module